MWFIWLPTGPWGVRGRLVIMQSTGPVRASRRAPGYRGAGPAGHGGRKRDACIGGRTRRRPTAALGRRLLQPQRKDQRNKQQRGTASAAADSRKWMGVQRESSAGCDEGGGGCDGGGPGGAGRREGGT